MIRAGTTVVISVSGSADSFWTSIDFWNGVTADELRSRVIGMLNPIMDVQTFTLSDRGFSDLGTWQFNATLNVAPYGDRGAADDLAADVRHAFYEVTGYLPTTSARGPQPELAPSVVSDLGKNIGSATGGIGDALSGVKDTIDRLVAAAGGALTAGLIVAGLVVGFVVFRELRD